MEIVTSWRTLFAYAHALGQAKLAMIDNPSDENEKAYATAKARHDDYVSMCLKADRMDHFPDLRARK